jgi:hypothetical protein
LHRHAGAERVEQRLHARGREQLVRGDLVRRNVVCLRLDPVAEDRVRLVQPRKPSQTVLDFAGDPAHDLAVLAAHVRVQAAEIAQPGRVPAPPRKP